MSTAFVILISFCEHILLVRLYRTSLANLLFSTDLKKNYKFSKQVVYQVLFDELIILENLVKTLQNLNISELFCCLNY